ncbi:MAG TPA: ABC transporter substrate-binding protein [Mesorhizobium sp.]|jgi:NitT/TauT family transport system substrate-binding protein|uniref:ABC transporter substrate-binding protein n=1 Tax=Mesorhizobium sp. TaxID=1871066 RepID=UPI002DDD32AA|nr:ABC transporter substrate-binding protein [Mesorhizobium sp.]HEV2505185.1 ABC transporter substrate-binding protein [Mesorhizobium sp.]
MTPLAKIVLGLVSAFWLFPAQMSVAQTLAPVRFGVDAYTTGSQIWIAKEKGFFEKEGIDAQITTFATGVEAIDALLIGRADMAVGLDFPIVSRMQGGKLTVLAGIFHSMPGFHKLVVANDIKQAKDLAGKKIGIATGTAQHLITIKYLEENGIPEDKVEIVGFTSLMEIVASLRSGRIDAAFVWADGTQRTIDGGKHYVLTDDAAAKRSSSAYIVAQTDFTQKHPELTVATLRALDAASQFIAQNKDEAAGLIAKNTRAPRETMRDLLNYNEFALALTDYERSGFNEVADFLARTKSRSVSFDKGVNPEFLEKAAPGLVKLGN